MLLVGLVQLPAGEGGTAGFEDNFLVGCGGGNCHGLSTSALQFELEGVPGEYEAERVYTLNLSIQGGPVVTNGSSLGQGGFNLYVTGGQFQLMGPDSGNLRLGRSDRELSHTANESDRRYWNFRWLAPESGSGDVEFQLAVLAGDANGDGEGDQWETQRIICKGSDFSWRQWVTKGLGIALVAGVLLYARSRLKEADRAQRERMRAEAEAEAENEGSNDGSDGTDGTDGEHGTDRRLKDPLAPPPIDIDADIGIDPDEGMGDPEPDPTFDDHGIGDGEREATRTNGSVEEPSREIAEELAEKLTQKPAEGPVKGESHAGSAPANER